MSEQTVETPWMTIDEAADYLRVAPRTVRSYVADGRLRYYRVGRSLRFLEKDLERFVKKGA